MHVQDQVPDRDTARRQPPSRASARDDDVLAAAAAATSGASSPQEVLELQRAIGNAAVARLVTAQRHACDDACGHQPSVQRAAVPDVLRRAGRPLDTSLRAEMEARLGADFSGVRIHDDTTARRSAADLGARAYTSGHHVVIGAGGADRHTLAHELIHVVQQSRGPVAGTDTGDGLRVSDPGDRFERAAEEGARRAMVEPVPDLAGAPAAAATTGTGPTVGHSGPGGGAAVQRRIDFQAGNIPFARVLNAQGNIVRPSWTGRWGTAQTGAATRNHTIAYDHIADSMVNVINQLWQDVATFLAANPVTPGNPAPPASVVAVNAQVNQSRNRLIALTNTLYPNRAVPEYARMQADRASLMDRICTPRNHQNPPANLAATLQRLATRLESHLMSAPDNVRAGQGALNSAIGNNIDPPLGPVVTLPAHGAAPPRTPLVAGQPAPVVPIAWMNAANWGEARNAPANLQPGQRFYTVKPTQNEIVYRFLQTAPQFLANNITVVRNTNQANPVAGWLPTAGGQPLTSTSPNAAPLNIPAVVAPVVNAPTATNAPVLVFDPAGRQLPYRFG